MEIFVPDLDGPVEVKTGLRRTQKGAVLARALPRLTGLPGLPTPPATLDLSAPALASLHNWYGNDTIGNCVIAAGYHILGVISANAGQMFSPTYAQCVADYSAIAGYIPGDPETDVGSDPHGAMYYWRTKGFANGSRVMGYFAIDVRDHEMVKTCLWLFENLFLGAFLPPGWPNTALGHQGDGFVWDATSSNGVLSWDHMVSAHGYDDTGVKVCTWGKIGTVTWRALDYIFAAGQSYDAQVYVMLTQAQIARGQALAPNGFDWTTLINYFNSIDGYSLWNGYGETSLRQHIRRGRCWRSGRRAETF